MATTISKLEVELTLDSSRFEAKVRGSKSALAAFGLQVGKVDKRVKRHEKSIRSLSTSFRHTIVTLGLMRDAMRTAWRVSGGLVQGIVDVTAEFERLNVLLTGMSKGTTAIEKATDATEQFNQVIAMAKNAPFAVKELTNSWVKFKSVGVDPATGSLNALVDAVSAFGGTGDILHRATIAVQQMAGKGVISMEELRQQMGEAVPQAMVLLARGMNMSVGQMVDAISKGAVVAKPALQKMFAEFDLTFGGASQRLMETYIGSLARLSTVWQLTLKEMGEASGLFEAVKEEVKLLIVQLDDPAVRRFGIDVASSMVKAFRIIVHAIRETVDFLSKHSKAVWGVIAAWGAFKAVNIAQHMIAASVAVNGLTRAISLLAATGMAKLTGNTKRAAAAWGLLTIQFKKALKVIRLISKAGWIGILLSIAAAVWGWVAATKSVNEELESGLDLVKRYGEAAEKASISLAKLEVKDQRDRLVKMSKFMADQVAALRKAKEDGEDTSTLEFSIDFLQGQYQRLLRTVKENEALIEDAVSGSARRAADSASRQMMTAFRAGMEEARNLARDTDIQIDTRFEEGEITAKQRLEQRLVVWKSFQEKQKVFAAEKIEEQRRLILAATQEMGAAQNQQQKNDIQIRIDAAVAMIKQISAVSRSEQIRIANDLAHISAPTVLLSAAEKAMEGYTSKLNTLLGNSQGKLASLNAAMFDGSSRLASFIAKVNSGKIFGNVAEWSEPMKEAMRKIIPLLFEIDKVSDDLKKKKSFESAMRSAEKTLAAATEEANIFGEAVTNGLNEVQNARARKFRTRIAAIASEYGRSSEEAKKLSEIQQKLLDQAIEMATNSKILSTRQELEKLQVAGIQNARDRFAAEQELFDQQWKTFLLENAQAKNIGILTTEYEKLREAKAKAFEDSTPMKRLLRDWEDTRGKLEASYADWMSSFVDTLVDGVAEGKIAFADFAKSILKDLLKIYLRALIVRAVMAAFGGGGAEESARPEGFSVEKWGFAKGGIMSPNGPLNTYARGGIATKPQIAVFGEGDQNEAYVPLPDGRSIPVSMSGGKSQTPPDVTVNVINESGIPVDAEQTGGLEFDGEGFVLDVVLKAARRPGGFRDGLKSATA